MSRLTEPIGPTDHVIGRPGALLGLVEYGDYTCPFCARAHLEVLEVLRSRADDVCYAFRHFPLAHAHPYALLAAQAAEAAGAQGRFWPMHALLLEHQETITPEALTRYADALDLDTSRFARELMTAAHLPRIQADFHTGVRSGVSDTPTFFLDGARVDRGWDAESLKRAIRQHPGRSVYRI